MSKENTKKTEKRIGMSFLERATYFYKTHEHRISSYALVFGFIVDNFTLRRIDLFFENFVMASYLVVAGVSIALVNILEEKGGASLHPIFRRAHWLLSLAIQFVFGGLFSAFVVFYSRSASLVSSWPFILILFGLLIGNEFFKKHYERLVFQVGIYFVALFSYFIFSVPILIGEMGPAIFLLSGVVSLCAISLLFCGLRKIVPRRYVEGRRGLFVTIGSIFLSINILYFTNIIPPIPLSLKDAEVFHNVERVGGGYRVVAEKRGWYEVFFPTETLHVEEGGSAYVFSAIFAPTRLQTSIVHHWYYYNKEKGLWVSSHKVDLPILGGRGGGYRIYSFKQDIAPGLWRVDVETKGGLGVGRLEFMVERLTDVVTLEERML